MVGQNGWQVCTLRLSPPCTIQPPAPPPRPGHRPSASLRTPTTEASEQTPSLGGSPGAGAHKGPSRGQEPRGRLRKCTLPQSNQLTCLAPTTSQFCTLNPHQRCHGTQAMVPCACTDLGKVVANLRAWPCHLTATVPQPLPPGVRGRGPFKPRPCREAPV